MRLINFSSFIVPDTAWVDSELAVSEGQFQKVSGMQETRSTQEGSLGLHHAKKTVVKIN
jgi:hypothetical protein